MSEYQTKNIGIPPEFERALGLCALIPSLTDSVAWEILDRFMSTDAGGSADGGAFLPWVKRSGFVEFAGPVEWRIAGDQRRELAKCLEESLRRSVHTFLADRFSGTMKQTTNDPRSLKLLTTYCRTAGSLERDAEIFEPWLQLEQMARVEVALDQQKVVADLVTELAEFGWIDSTRPEVLFFRAMYLYSTRQFRRAEPLLSAIANRPETSRIVGIAKHCLGHLVLQGYARPAGSANQVRAAEGLFYRALEVLAQNGDDIGAGLVTAALAKLLLETGRAARARSLVLRQLASAARLPPTLRVSLLMSAANSALESARQGTARRVDTQLLQRARDEVREALEVAREQGLREQEVGLLVLLAKAESRLGNPGAAMTAAERGVEVATVVEDARGECLARNQAGYALLRLASNHYPPQEELLKRAMNHFRSAKTKGERLHDPRLVSYQLVGMARVAETLGRVQEALRHLERAREVSVQANDPRGLSIASAEAARILTGLGDAESAEQLLTVSLAAIGGLGREADERRLRYAQTRMREKRPPEESGPLAK